MKNSVEDSASHNGATVMVRQNGYTNGHRNKNGSKSIGARSRHFLEFCRVLDDISEAEQEKFLRQVIAMGPLRMLAAADTAPLRFQKSGIRVNGMTEVFDARRYFTENSRSYWVGKTFEQHVLSRVEDAAWVPTMMCSVYEVSDTLHDSSIVTSLGIGNGLCTFVDPTEVAWMMASLTSRQKCGEAGILPVDRKSAVLGYLKCADGKIRGTSVYLNRERGSPVWECTCTEPANRARGDSVLCVDTRVCEGM